MVFKHYSEIKNVSTNGFDLERSSVKSLKSDLVNLKGVGPCVTTTKHLHVRSNVCGVETCRKI